MILPTLPKKCHFGTFHRTKLSLHQGNTRINTVKLEKVYGMSRRKRRGAAVVEFAIVAPLFFLLIFGMIEFGRVIMVQQIITNASREGARVAVLDPPAGGTTLPSVLSTVNSYLSSANISGATITTDPSEPSTAGYNEPVTVTVSVPFSQISWLPAPWFFDVNTQIRATSIMRRETVQ